MFNETVNNLLSNPEFITKMASRFPNAVNSSISSAVGMTGDLDTDLYKVAHTIGSKAYFQRRESAIINSGLLALSEVENG